MKLNLTPLTIDLYTERFAVTLLISMIAHLSIISGISFVMPHSDKVHVFPTMDVILVQKRSDTVPEKPDFLAQVTQDGSGQGDPKDQARPSTPTLAPFPGPLAELVVTPPPLQFAAALIDPEIQLLTTDKPSSFLVERQPLEPVKPPEEPTEEIFGEAEETTDVPEEFPDLDTLKFNELSSMASIQAELDERFEDFVKKPGHKYIDSSTKEYAYASYMDTWRLKMLEFVNKEYTVLGKRIEGVLVLEVAINANGTINDIKLIKSSIRSPELERVARRSIRKAAPFQPFSNSIRKEKIDVLHITRTWDFYYDQKSKPVKIR